MFFYTVHMAGINVVFGQVTDSTPPCSSSDRGGKTGPQVRLKNWPDLILAVRFSIVTNIRLMVLCNKTSSVCVWTESFDDVWWCHYLKEDIRLFFSPLFFFSNKKKAIKWAYLLISDLQPQVAIMSCDNVITEWSQWTVFLVSFVRAHLFIYKRENM